MKLKKQYLKLGVFGILTGFVNGLFGAGGGMVAVELLKSAGLETKKAHATSIAVILPLCVISSVMYYLDGSLDIAQGLKFIPFGLAGAVIGTFIMKKISSGLLKKIFCIFLIYGGARMIFGG